MSGYTKGPWLVADGSDGFVYSLNNEGVNHFWFNINTTVKGGADLDEIRANARLASSAPDLYEALKAVRQWWIDSNVDMPQDLGFTMCDAILKAEGKIK